MYHIPGHGSIDEKPLERYLTSTARIPLPKTEVADTIMNEEERRRRSLAILAKLVSITKDDLTKTISRAQENVRAKMIEDIFSTDDAKKMQIAAEQIDDTPTEDVARLIKIALMKNDPATVRIAAEKTFYAEDASKPELYLIIAERVEQMLADNNPLAVYNAAMLIPYINDKISKDRLTILDDLLLERIHELLSSGETLSVHMAAFMIPWVDGTEIPSLIREALGTKDCEAIQVAVRSINYAEVESRSALIEEALSVDDIDVQQTAARMIYSVTRADQDRLHILARTKLGDRIVEPALYLRSRPSNLPGVRRGEFEKTDSRTTLLGGELVGKAIVRHIDIESFRSWQKIFESWRIWKNNGFDYVPVEPILSVRLSRDSGEVAVSAGVLDLSLEDWRAMGGAYITELETERDKIIEISYEQIGVSHGHANNNDNFSLRFYRDVTGHIDFTRKPRIYVIDLDRARITKSIES